MNYFSIFGAALLLALLIASPALTNFKPFGDSQRRPWRGMLRDLAFNDLGAVTVTYLCRGANVAINSVTPPTATQAQQLVKQSATVAFGATGDVQALFTHNWGLDASAPVFLEPEIQVYQTLDGTYFPSLTFDVSNTNVVKINKAATNQPTTVVVILRRPHSIGQ